VNRMWQFHSNWEWNIHITDISSVKSFPIIETSEKFSLITKQNPAACHDRSMTTKLHTEIKRHKKASLTQITHDNHV
jgi:hypothetical protein